MWSLIFSSGQIFLFHRISPLSFSSENVADLSLNYRSNNWHCSSDLSNGILPPSRKVRATVVSTQTFSDMVLDHFSTMTSSVRHLDFLSRDFSLLVQLFDHKLNCYAHSSTRSTVKEWNIFFIQISSLHLTCALSSTFYLVISAFNQKE